MHPRHKFSYDDLKSTSMAASSSTYNYYYLPEELLLKILSALPIESLMRMRCACKFWNQLICSKSFVTTYNKNSSNTCNNNNYLLYHYFHYKPSSFTACVIDSTKSYNVVKSHDYSLDDVLGEFKEFTVYGSCNGLLCLSDYNREVHEDIVLFNPIIRRWKKLPPLGIPFEIKRQYTRLCFGFHEDDYKVIVVALGMEVYHVYIYSLSTDNWKYMKFVDITHVKNADANLFDISRYPKARLVNGVAYFMCTNVFYKVVCFDLSRAIIHEIDFPANFLYEYSAAVYMMEEYGESIALIPTQSRHIGNRNIVEIWILVRMSDNSFTWEEKKNIECSARNICWPIGIINKDTLVITVNKSKRRSRFPSKEAECADRVDFFVGNLVLLTETTLPSSVGRLQHIPATARKRKLEENEERVIHRRRITKGATSRTTLSNNFQETSCSIRNRVFEIHRL